MKLNLEGQTPLEIFGVSNERAIELQGEFDKVHNTDVESTDTLNIREAIKTSVELASTEGELGLLLINVGRNIGSREVLNALMSAFGQ